MNLKKKSEAEFDKFLVELYNNLPAWMLTRRRSNVAAPKTKYDTTNTAFAKTDGNFRAACEKAEVKPTSRQASKWRNKMGKAYAAS